MSSPKLKEAAQYVIKRSKERKNTIKKQKDSQARSDAEKEPGQYFVINKENEAAKILKVTGIRLGKQERRDLFALLIRFLRRKERALKLDTELKKFLMSQKPRFKQKRGDAVFIVANFEAAKRLKFKSKNKEDIAQIQANFLNSLTRVKKPVSAATLSRSSQIGHGDRGIAASQFALERATDEAVDKFDLSDAETKQLKTILFRQREKYDMKVDVTHQQFLSHKGKFNKKFTFILNSQYFEKNREDALVERKAFEDAIEELDLLEQETSTKPLNALEEILAEAIAPKGAKVSGKRRKTIKESSRASVTTKRKNEKVVAYEGSRGVPTKKIKKQKATPSNISIAALIGVFNQQLSGTVINNMGDPRLNNRTGRFASSVRVTDITTTAKGFPSIGYTYQKDPYQTFEVGYKRGDSDRDPRKLIDASIREIAVKMAIGRFYTRRV